ncbi:MAG: hydrogenase nickel incorporation protein HypB [Silicimonas sp.]
MCNDCGCAVGTGKVEVRDALGHVTTSRAADGSVEVLTAILRQNDHEAAHNRAHFDAHGVLAINLMSAPGSGKTRLLEATIGAIGDRVRIAVIEGDLETENDALRIRAKGVPAVQITTGQTCHLDAHMVHDALHLLALAQVDLLFIENVGNLVCPAGFDLGQHANVTLLSVAEGDDKPAKYPVMFRASDLVLLSKADLLPVFDDFAPERATGHVRALANDAEVFPVSARRSDLLAPWLDWLDDRLRSLHSGAVLRPRMARSHAPHGHVAP